MSGQDLERLHHLMRDIGELERFELVAWLSSQAMWQVITDVDQPIVLIKMDAGRQLVTLSSELGAPATDRAPAIDRLALDYATLGELTGGAHLTRDPEDGVYTLAAALGWQCLTRETAGATLRRFATMAAGWRDIVSGVATSDAGFDPGADATGLVLRV